MLKRIVQVIKTHEKPTASIETTTELFPSMQLTIYSYSKSNIDQFAQFAFEYFHNLDAIQSDIVAPRFRIQKWTVLKSPHVHKTSFRALERRTNVRELYISNLADEMIDKSLWYIDKHLVDGVWMEAKIHQYEAPKL